MINHCISYFTHVDSEGAPILGTMFAAAKAHGQAKCKRLIAPVPPYQVAVTKECRPESRLRYFYKIKFDKRLQTNVIVPNSMTAGYHKPKSMCSGTESLLEFIITTADKQ